MERKPWPWGEDGALLFLLQCSSRALHQIKGCGCVRCHGRSIIRDLRGLRSTVFICKAPALSQVTFLVPSLKPGCRSVSSLCSLNHSYMLRTLGVCRVSLCVSLILCLVWLLSPPQAVQPHSARAQAWALLDEAVGRALEQTGDLYNQRLYRWDLHSLTVMSASETPVTSFFPPWWHPLDSVDLIFTISQSEHVDSPCVSWRSRASPVVFSKKSDFL